MADHSDSSSSSRQPHRLFLSLMIGGGISVVLALFAIGYLTLTTPEPVPDDIYTIMQKVLLGVEDIQDLEQVVKQYHKESLI